MIVMYLLSGVGSMVLSYVWSFHIRHQWHHSIGASGAVCGMVGAALLAGHRLGPAGAEVKRAMIRWAVILLAFGLVVSGIDNAAHIAGFALGAAMGHLMPLGLTQTVGANRALSVVVLGMMAGVIGCVALTLLNLRAPGDTPRYPASLDHDQEPRSIFFFTYAEGEAPDHSSQTILIQSCQEASQKAPATDDTLRTCELALRANPAKYPRLYTDLIAQHQSRGHHKRARALKRAFRAFYGM